MSRAIRAVVCLLALAAAGGAADKDYHFPEVRIEIAVERDGSFLVDEFRTFEFRGRFSFAYVVIPLRVVRLGVRREVSVSNLAVMDEQGQALRTETGENGGALTARWFFSARDERRTFHIHYRVAGGITSYADVSELYWQAIGDGWDRPARNVRTTVVLPGSAPSREDLLVWGHGPLAGWAEVVDERTARFSTPELAPRQFFEVRVVWPAGLVSGVPSDRHTRASIKAEEEDHVRDTIARVRSAQADQERRRQRSAENRRKLLKVLSVWGAWQFVGPLLCPPPPLMM